MLTVLVDVGWIGARGRVLGGRSWGYPNCRNCPTNIWTHCQKNVLSHFTKLIGNIFIHVSTLVHCKYVIYYLCCNICWNCLHWIVHIESVWHFVKFFDLILVNFFISSIASIFEFYNLKPKKKRILFTFVDSKNPTKRCFNNLPASRGHVLSLFCFILFPLSVFGLHWYNV